MWYAEGVGECSAHGCFNPGNERATVSRRNREGVAILAGGEGNDATHSGLRFLDLT